MKSATMVALIFLLCFTFAGNAAVWANPDNPPSIEVEFGGKKFTIVDRGNRDVIIKDEAERTLPVKSGPAWDMEIREKGREWRTIRKIKDGTFIFSGNGTCVTYYSNGGYTEYCW